jgi:hypothetical protein
VEDAAGDHVRLSSQAVRDGVEIGEDHSVSLAVSELVTGLVFPVAVLLLGALVSGLLIPGLTRRRDDHRKALEIKTGLVEEISESVMRFMMAIQFAELGSSAQTQDKFDEAYREWETESAVIGAKFGAYLHEGNLSADWAAFCKRLTRFYALSGVPLAERREAASELFEAYHINWPGSDVEPDVQTWRYVWGLLKNAILNEKAELSSRLLRARLDAFEHAGRFRRPTGP